MGGYNIMEMKDALTKKPEMKRAAEMWRNTVMPGSPDPAERGSMQNDPARYESAIRELNMAPGPPEVPRSGLETIRHPKTGELKHVPPGTTWEPVYGVNQEFGQPVEWRLKYPQKR